MRLHYDRASLERYGELTHEVRGLPRFMDDLLHLNPASDDYRLLLDDPSAIQWSRDGSFVILPNFSYILPEHLREFRHDPERRAYGAALIAWYVHPKQLEETVFSQPECRADFREALKRVNYVPAFTPTSSKQRRDDRRRIRELEDASGIPYLASLVDVTPEHLPMMQDLRDRTIEALGDAFGLRNDDFFSLYFHKFPTETAITLHMHIRVNYSCHPADAANSVHLDDLIAVLEQGRTAKDVLLDTPQHYSFSRSPHSYYLQSGFTQESARSPFLACSLEEPPAKALRYGDVCRPAAGKAPESPPSLTVTAVVPGLRHDNGTRRSP